VVAGKWRRRALGVLLAVLVITAVAAVLVWQQRSAANLSGARIDVAGR